MAEICCCYLHFTEVFARYPLFVMECYLPDDTGSEPLRDTHFRRKSIEQVASQFWHI